MAVREADLTSEPYCCADALSQYTTASRCLSKLIAGSSPSSNDVIVRLRSELQQLQSS